MGRERARGLLTEIIAHTITTDGAEATLEHLSLVVEAVEGVACRREALVGVRPLLRRGNLHTGRLDVSTWYDEILQCTIRLGVCFTTGWFESSSIETNQIQFYTKGNGADTELPGTNVGTW